MLKKIFKIISIIIMAVLLILGTKSLAALNKITK